MHEQWHISGGRIVDPASGRDEVADIYLCDGRIAANPVAGCDAVRKIDAEGLVVVPGFIDPHVHFREPGDESAESLSSGSIAAARGGFVMVAAMANTRPPVDSPESVREMRRRSGACRGADILLCGCLTLGRRGEEVADIAGMVHAGILAVSDDGSTVGDLSVMRDAMVAAKACGIPVLDHAMAAELSTGGVVREGGASALLKLPGIPASAEASIVERDIELCGETGCRVHIQHVSTREAVELLRAAHRNDLPITSEVTPHHLCFTDEDLMSVGTSLKVNPPVGSSQDRESLLNAVSEGMIQAFATDHAPHCMEAKSKGFLDAPFGAIGLETAIGATYSAVVMAGKLDLMRWIQMWTSGPASILGLPVPSLSVGMPADIAVLDLESDWTVRSSEFRSKSRNTPFEGRTLRGRAIHTFRNGVRVWP